MRLPIADGSDHPASHGAGSSDRGRTMRSRSPNCSRSAINSALVAAALAGTTTTTSSGPLSSVTKTVIAGTNILSGGHEEIKTAAGFEPAMGDLQSPALPLGHAVAVRTLEKQRPRAISARGSRHRPYAAAYLRTHDPRPTSRRRVAATQTTNRLGSKHWGEDTIDAGFLSTNCERGRVLDTCRRECYRGPHVHGRPFHVRSV
jgi:hypothetical protein